MSVLLADWGEQFERLAGGPTALFSVPIVPVGVFGRYEGKKQTGIDAGRRSWSNWRSRPLLEGLRMTCTMIGDRLRAQIVAWLSLDPVLQRKNFPGRGTLWRGANLAADSALSRSAGRKAPQRPLAAETQVRKVFRLDFEGEALGYQSGLWGCQQKRPRCRG